VVVGGVAEKHHAMLSFVGELKALISVQNLLLRSMSLTLKTTCPIFLIFIGDFSSAIESSLVLFPGE
jgi:hypothetical protein